MRAFVLVIVLAMALPVVADEVPVDAQTGLKMAPGWLHVRAHCGGCHSHALVTGQRANRDSWLAMIRWMQETQNLWQLQPAVEKELLDYLAANYAPANVERRAPLPADMRP